MKPKSLSRLLMIGIALVPQVVFADVVVTYNTLAAGGHGVYNGAGGVDGGFTTTTTDYGASGSLILSLRGAQRYLGPITPTGVNKNNYVCSGSEQCNFDWSVATTGSLTIGNFTYDLLVKNLTQNKSFDFTGALDPSKLDDKYWNGGVTSTYSATATGFQNSEYLGFHFMGLDWHPSDEVVATLSAISVSGALADPSVTIGFNNSPSQVPEPSSVALIVTVMGLLSWTSLRRRQRAQAGR